MKTKWLVSKDRGQTWDELGTLDSIEAPSLQAQVPEGESLQSPFDPSTWYKWEEQR